MHPFAYPDAGSVKGSARGFSTGWVEVKRVVKRPFVHRRTTLNVWLNVGAYIVRCRFNPRATTVLSRFNHGLKAVAPPFDHGLSRVAGVNFSSGET